jgi:hypothetical protein
VTVSDSGALVMPTALPNIRPWEDDPRPRKLGCFGRRSGKTRGMLRMAVLGHGGLTESGQVRHPGLAQGRDVLWLGPDYKQLSIVWNEEIKPRFDAADGCWTREAGSESMTAGLGTARLILRSVDTMTAIKGAGAKVGGIVIDEGAHMDLLTILKQAVLPVLLDNGGWLVIGSTPNFENDGHVDDLGNRPTPSYFNTLCDVVAAGKRPLWALYEGDARANPKISAVAFQEMVDEYPSPDDPRLLQEVFAKRIRGGVGTAFPQLGDVHVLPDDWQPPPKARTFIGIDWGWTQPGWAGLFVAMGASCVLWREWPFNGNARIGVAKETPVDLARRIATDLKRWCGASGRPAMPTSLWYDAAMAAVTDGALSPIAKIEEELLVQLRQHAPVCLPATKGSGSRIARKETLDSMLRYRIEDGVLVEPPRLQIVKTWCPVWWQTVSALPRDPKRPEDVDTTANDHPYDGSTYALVQEFPVLRAERKAAKAKTGDRLSDKEHDSYDRVIETAIHGRRRPHGARVLGGV